MLVLLLVAATITVFDVTRGKTAFDAPQRPMAVPEDILELRFYPDRHTFSPDPSAPGKLQTGPFNVTAPIVCKRLPSGHYKCTSTARSSVCDAHKCEDTEVVTSYFPAIECETHHYRGRPYVLLDSCSLAERKSSNNTLIDYVFSFFNI